MGISNTSTVLTLRLSAETQSSDFYQADTLDTRSSQIKWQVLKRLPADGNPVAVVTMKILAVTIIVLDTHKLLHLLEYN